MATVLGASALGVPAAAAGKESSRVVECRITATFPINPAPLVHNGLGTAPFPGLIYDGVYVEVPRDAIVVGQALTDQAGKPPSSTALPDETWSIVHEGRPDATWHSFGYGAGRDPWLVMLEVKGLSHTNPPAKPTWRWTVDYVRTDAGCSTGQAGPQPMEIGAGSLVSPTSSGEATTLELPGGVKVGVTTAPDGKLLIRFISPVVRTRSRLTFTIVRPRDKAKSSQSNNLNCTNAGGAAQCSGTPDGKTRIDVTWQTPVKHGDTWIVEEPKPK